MDYKTLIEQSELNTAIEREEFNKFSLLKPKLKKDGNQWCCLYGSDIQEGIVGYGETPYLAIIAWNEAWEKE